MSDLTKYKFWKVVEGKLVPDLKKPEPSQYGYMVDPWDYDNETYQKDLAAYNESQKIKLPFDGTIPDKEVLVLNVDFKLKETRFDEWLHLKGYGYDNQYDTYYLGENKGMSERYVEEIFRKNPFVAYPIEKGQPKNNLEKEEQQRMEQLQINEGSKLIAEFMGWYERVNDRWKIKGLPNNMEAFDDFKKFVIKHSIQQGSLYDLYFHTSWDWLMPVVEKIENLGFGISISADTVDIGWKYLADDEGNDLYPSFPDIYFDWNTNYYQSAKATAANKINAVWLAVVEFIKWYNQNK